RIVEVGPRDGLQNEAQLVPPITRITLIERLIDTGLTTIEAGSFVSQKWVPQMAGTDEVLRAFSGRTDINLPVLVPNAMGLDSALQAGAREIAVFAAASEKKNVAEQLHDLGCYELSLGDTIGVGTPKKARALVHRVGTIVPIERVAVHYHDTYGQALANIYASLEEGVRVVDSSVAGLGGCPYAKGASGNVATED
ncbi:hypothetical protein Angca_004638, partial [Angiostrongylus cantonensis]